MSVRSLLSSLEGSSAAALVFTFVDVWDTSMRNTNKCFRFLCVCTLVNFIQPKQQHQQKPHMLTDCRTSLDLSKFNVWGHLKHIKHYFNFLHSSSNWAPEIHEHFQSCVLNILENMNLVNGGVQQFKAKTHHSVSGQRCGYEILGSEPITSVENLLGGRVLGYRQLRVARLRHLIRMIHNTWYSWK